MASSLLLKLGIDVSPLTRSLTQAENKLKRFGYKAERIGRDLTTRVSLPIIGIGAAAVKTFADFDKLEKGLAAVSGSAEEGARQFSSLLNIVKDTQTTLDLKSAAAGSLNLQAVGVSAANAERLLRQFGRAATLTGEGSEDAGEATRQLAQAIGKGKILETELRVIRERLPGLTKIIKDEFGTITAEGINKAGVSAGEFLKRLTKAAETSKTFQNIQGGLGKAFETFGIELQIAGREIGKTLSETLNLEENLTRLSAAISDGVNAFKALNPTLQKTVIYSAGLVAAIGPMFLGLGAVAKALPLLRSGFSLLLAPITSLGGVFAFLASPVGLVVVGLALLTAGIIAAYRNSGYFRGLVAELGESLARLGDSVVSFGVAIYNIIDAALKPFGGALNVIGTIAKNIIGVYAGLAAVVIKITSTIATQLSNTFKGIGQILSGEFKAGFSTLKNSLANPANLAKIAVAGISLGKTFGKAFKQTVGGLSEGTLTSFLKDVKPGGGGGGGGTDDDTGGSGGGGGPLAVQAIDTGQVDGVNLFVLSLQQAGRNTEYLQEKIEGLKPALQDDFFGDYRSGLEVITEKQEAFGSTYDSLSERIGLTRSLITSLVEDGYPASVGAVALLTEELNGQLATQEELNESIAKMQAAMELTGNVSKTAFAQVSSAMSKGASAVKAFGSAVVSALRDAIAAEIKLAVATQVAGALKLVPPPFNVALAAAAGAGAAALFTSALGALNIPLLAAGGITTGAGLFVAGEAGPEAIIPLNRLHEFMNTAGSSVQVTGEFELQADRLVAMVRQAEHGYNRAY